MKKGFSASAIAIVVVLLCALGLAASKVTPAPPGPPEPPKPVAATPSSPSTKDDEADNRPHTMPKPPPKPIRTSGPAKKPGSKEAFNPASIDVTPDYWKQNQDGQKGVEEMDAKMKKATAEQKAEHDAEQKKSGGKSVTPVSK